MIDITFENDLLAVIKNHDTQLALASSIKFSLYKNNKVDTIEIKINSGNNSYVTVVFIFHNKTMNIKVGDISGGNADISVFKNFFDGVFNVIANAYGDLFTTYRLSKHW